MIFLVIAIIAAIFGFGGIAGTAAGIAQVLFYIFIAIFIISLLFGLVRGRRPSGASTAKQRAGNRGSVPGLGTLLFSIAERQHSSEANRPEQGRNRVKNKSLLSPAPVCLLEVLLVCT